MSSALEEAPNACADLISRLRAEQATLQARFGVRRLGLFGSRARGEARSGSDIDVLVEFDSEAHTYDNLFDLHAYLQDQLGANVDVLTPDGLSSYMRPHIERDLLWI